MAVEHEPGCDQQHTVRQRCNQNALFAEQGEVTPNGDAPAPEAPAPKRPRTRRAVSQAEAPALASANDEPPEAPVAAPEPEALDEIVSIREEVFTAEHLAAGPQASRPWAPDPARTGMPLGLIALAGFGLVATIFLVLLLRGGGHTSDES